MTTMEIISMGIGIILLSIWFTNIILKSFDTDSFGRPKHNGKTYGKVVLIFFLSWLVTHIAMSVDFTKKEQINRFIKFDKVYYLDMHKSEDLILDKEAYDKLKKLGNDANLHISQQFLIVTLNSDKKEQRYNITERAYNNLLENKETSVDVECDKWGNKHINSSLYE